MHLLKYKKLKFIGDIRRIVQFGLLLVFVVVFFLSFWLSWFLSIAEKRKKLRKKWIFQNLKSVIQILLVSEPLKGFDPTTEPSV